MANRIHEFRIDACPEEHFVEVHEYLDFKVHYCYLRAETVRKQYWEKFGHLIESGDLVVKFADDFSDLDD